MKSLTSIVAAVLLAAATMFGQSAHPLIGSGTLYQQGDGPFNVKAYGAKADGSTDDTAAIQATNDAAASVCGTVLFPSSSANYVIASYLKISSCVTWKGEGGATLYFTGDGGGACTAAQTLAAQTGFIRYQGGTNRITGLTIKPANQTAGTCMLNVQDGAETSTWEIDHNKIYGGSTGSTNVGVYGYSVDSFSIDHNVIEYVAQAVAFGAHTVARADIGPGNVFSWGTNNSAFLVTLPGGLNCFQITVYENTFEGYGTTNGLAAGCSNGATAWGNYFGDPSATGGKWLQNIPVAIGNYIAGNGTNVTGLYNVGVAINNWVYAPSFLAYGGTYIANTFYVSTTGCAVSLNTGGYFDFQGNTFYNTAANSVCGYANGPNWIVKDWATNTDNTTSGLASNVKALLGQMSPGAFSALPACSAQYEGNSEPVTDSTTNTHGATITGGGADHVTGTCYTADGTTYNWVVQYP